MAPASDNFTPAEIRRLRGTLSRPRFGALLGVSANTVYRWELAPDSPHHLSPSTSARERLQRLAQGDALAGPGAFPILWRGSPLERGPLSRAYLHLIESRYAEAFAALDELDPKRLSPDERAEAAALCARGHLLGRGDAAAALTALGMFREPEQREHLGPHARAALSLWQGFALGWLDGRIQDRPRAMALLHGARAEMLRLDERGGIFWADLGIALVHLSLYEVEQARRHLARCLAHDLQGARLTGRMWFHEAAGHLARVEGNYRQSALEYGKALNLAESSGDRYARARALALICERRMEACDPPQTCVAAGEEARALYAELGDPFDYPSRCMLRALGEAWWRVGRLDELARSLGPAVERMESAGASPYLLRELLGRAALRRGDLAEARAQLAACRRLTGPVERSFGLVMADMLEASILQAERSLPQALEAWCRARSGAELFGSFALRGNTELGRADASIDAGDVAGAREAVDSAERDLAQVRAPWLHARLARVRARCLALEGRFAAARVLAAQAAEALERAADPFAAARFREETATWPQPAGLDAVTVPGDLVERVSAAASGGVTRVLSELCAALADALAGTAAEVLDGAGARLAVAGPAGTQERAFELVASFGDRLGRRFQLCLSEVMAPPYLRSLLAVTELALENAALRESASHRAVAHPAEEGIHDGVVIASESMRALFGAVRRVGRLRSTVLISGESGTGKELVARALHSASGRKGKLVSFNCAAVPAQLFDSQLFGHVRGAFTGADRDFPGFVRAADGGTLFLDEIGELPLEVQPKLLRFLQEGIVDPVGATASVTVDVRVVAATHRSLDALVRAGRFREDLYYRLNVVPLRVPPLRERPEELPLLVRHVLGQLCGEDAPRVSEDALACLASYAWPGNVRQLRNELERLVALHGAPAVIVPEMLSREIRGPTVQSPGLAANGRSSS